MKIFHYAPDTGELVNESAARESPLEPGVFLIPAFATKNPPPAFGPNEVAVFDGEAWAVRPDFRGAEYWVSRDDKREISAVGETVPANAYLNRPPPPVPTPEQTKAAKIAIVQQHLDATAKSFGYDDMKTAVGYAEEPIVPKFQNEGRTLRAWRSLVWAAGYAILDEVTAGRRPVPTDAELLAELPVLETAPDA